MANTLSDTLNLTTHTSPKAPLPITLTISKSSRVNRRVLIDVATGLTEEETNQGNKLTVTGQSGMC